MFVMLNKESSSTWLTVELLTSDIFSESSLDESEVPPLPLLELDELLLELEELELEELELDELLLELEELELELELLSDEGAGLELELDEETSSGYSVPWPGCAKATLKQDKININVMKNAKYLYFIFNL